MVEGLVRGTDDTLGAVGQGFVDARIAVLRVGHRFQETHIDSLQASFFLLVVLAKDLPARCRNFAVYLGCHLGVPAVYLGVEIFEGDLAEDEVCEDDVRTVYGCWSFALVFGTVRLDGLQQCRVREQGPRVMRDGSQGTAVWGLRSSLRSSRGLGLRMSLLPCGGHPKFRLCNQGQFGSLCLRSSLGLSGGEKISEEARGHLWQGQG
jgi:hypothetical protein